MLNYFIRAFVLCLLLVLPAHAADDEDLYDIVGYRSGKNHWVLGDEVDDAALKGFTEGWSELLGCETQFDPERTVQFDGEDYEGSVLLFIVADQIRGVGLGLDSEELGYRSLKKYYRGRVGDCSVVADDETGIMWEDDDGDSVSVTRYHNEDGSSGTFVLYLRNDFAREHREPGTLPDWMRGFM